MKMRAVRKNEPMVAKVVNVLRTSILEGKVKAGEKLNETLIASQLGVSRSPVREALRLLESEHLVTSRGLKGTFVRDLSAKEVREIYSVLSFIHVAAIEDAVESWNSEKEAELRAVVNEEKKTFEAGDAKKSVLAARKFHRFIISAGGNDLLLRIYDLVRNHEERGRFLTMTLEPDDLAEAHGEHMAIAGALLGGDASGAIRLVKAHLDGNCQRVARSLTEREDTSKRQPSGQGGED